MKKAVVLVVFCLLVPAASSWAIPAPPWTEAQDDNGAYDLTIARDMSLPAQYMYDLTVTFNGTSLFGPDDPDGDPIQRFTTFVLYEPAAGGIAPVDSWEVNNPAYWTVKNPGNNGLVEWGNKTGADRLRIGDSITFRAELTGLLEYEGVVRSAIKVQYGNDSGWIRDTPELPPSLLSMLGLGCAAFAHRIRRRFKK